MVLGDLIWDFFDQKKIIKKSAEEFVKYYKLFELHLKSDSETFKKNIDIYMRRVYSKPGEDGQAYSNRITLGKNIKTIANNLKPRGHKPKEVTPARLTPPTAVIETSPEKELDANEKSVEPST